VSVLSIIKLLYYTGSGLGCNIPEDEGKRKIIEDTFTESMPNSESSGFDSVGVISPTDTPPEVDATSIATTGSEPDSFPDIAEEHIFEMSPDDDETAAREDFVGTKKRQRNVKCGGKHEQLEESSNSMIQKNEKDVGSKQLINMKSPEDEQVAMALRDENPGATANQQCELENAISLPSAAPGYERKLEFAFDVYGRNTVATSQGNERHGGIARGCENDEAKASWRCEQHGTASSLRCEQHGTASSLRCEQHGTASSLRCEQHGTASSWRCEQHGTASSWRCEQHRTAPSSRRGKNGAAASSRYKQHGTSSSRGCEKHGATASRKYWQQETREFVGYERKTVTTFMLWERQEVTEFFQYEQLQTMALLQKGQGARAISVYEEKKGKKEKKRTAGLTEYEEEKKEDKDGNEEKGEEEKAAAQPEYEEEKVENEDETEGKEEKGEGEKENEKQNDKEVTLPEYKQQKNENTESINYFSLFSYHPLPSENQRPFPCSEEKSKKLKDEEAEVRHYSDFDYVSPGYGKRPEPQKVSSFQLRT
jgi:hypothetical protein